MELENLIRKYLNFCQDIRNLNIKTVTAYSIDLEQFRKVVGDSIPDKDKMLEYIAYLQKNFRPRSVLRKVASVKAFFSYLVKNEIIMDNVFDKLNITLKEPEDLPLTVPRDDIEGLMDFMHGYRDEHRDASNYRLILRDVAVVEFLFATGARVSEVSNLTLECFDLKSGRVKLIGKRGRVRYVPIVNLSSMQTLRKYYEENEEAIISSGSFFVNNRGNRYSEQSIRRMVEKYRIMANIKEKITPHMFRHSVATYLIEDGADITLVQKILGHSSIRTTQIYIYLSLDAETKMLQELHPRNKMNINVPEF